MPTLNEAKDRRRVRPALTEDELARLIGVSEQRASYYLFAYDTGLRVKACKAATWGDIDSGMIRVLVGNAKGKKDDTFYSLHPRLVAELEKIRPAFVLPSTLIFPRVPSIKTFHKDCKRASVARYDTHGRQLDRHALRTTPSPHLARAGVLPQQAMRVLGHSDVHTTMKHYTALSLSDTAKAVGALPSIEPKKNEPESVALKATGTDNKTLLLPPQQKQQQLCGFGSLAKSTVDTQNVGPESSVATRLDKGLGDEVQRVPSTVLLGHENCYN